jgi:PIN domain nuclease of toxin-antitoxin system
LSKQARQLIERAPEIGVSAMSCWEIALLETSGRIRLDRPVRAWAARSFADERMRELPVTAEIAFRASALTALRDPSDRFIFATALNLDAQLVSRDGRLRDLDPRRVVW